MTEEIGYAKFLKDTAVNKLKDNIYSGHLSDSWSIEGAVNGGYSMSIAARALSDYLSHKDPLQLQVIIYPLLNPVRSNYI